MSQSGRNDDEQREIAELIEVAKGGDRDAFATLYSRYFDRVYGYLRVLLRESHAAEDAAQQVFMQAFEALPRYEQRGLPFDAWLFTIARNLGLQRLKERSRVRALDEDSEEVARAAFEGEESQQWALEWISDPDLMLFIERLPLAQRQVLLLRYMADMSHRQIAEILDRREDDVRALQYRALTFLRSRLGALGRRSDRRSRSQMARCRDRANVLRARRYALVS